MVRPAVLAPLAFAVAAVAAHAQPSNSPEQAQRAINPYVYMMDKAGHKVLVSTQFWRNDLKYDDRSFHRFLEVLAQLEKRGFQKNDKATIESWDKPQPFSRCFVYLEDLQSGRATKSGITSGTRVWCTETGISEIEIRNSDSPKHVAEIMQRFDMMFDKSRKAVQK